MSASELSNEVFPQLAWARLSESHSSKVLQLPKAPVPSTSTRSKPFKFPDPRLHPNSANWYTFDPDLYKNNDALVVSSPSPESEHECHSETIHHRSISSPQLSQSIDGFAHAHINHGYTHPLTDSQARRHSLQITIPSEHIRLSTHPNRMKHQTRSPNSPYARPVEGPHQSSASPFGTTGPSYITLAKPNSTRSSLACNACRKRKVRCVVPEAKEGEKDKVRVCERCSRMKLDCVWGEERRKKGHKEKNELEPHLSVPSSRSFVPSKFMEQIRQDTATKEYTEPSIRDLPTIHFLPDPKPGIADLFRPSSGETTSIISVQSNYPQEGISTTNSSIPSVSPHTNLEFSSPASNSAAPTLVSRNVTDMSLDQDSTPHSVGAPVVLSAHPCSVQGPASLRANVTQWPGQNLDGAFISSSNADSTTSNLVSTENASGPESIYPVHGLIDSARACMQNHAQGFEDMWGQAPSAAPTAAPGSAIHPASTIFPDLQLEQQETVFFPQFSTSPSETIDCSIQTDPPLMGTAYFSLAAHQDPFWSHAIGCEPDPRAPNYQLQPSGIQSSSDQSEVTLPGVDLQELMIPAGSDMNIVGSSACPQINGQNGQASGTLTWPHFPELDGFIPGSLNDAQSWNMSRYDAWLARSTPGTDVSP